MIQRDRDRRLTTLWNQGWLASVIAERLGYSHGSNVSHAAARLGLKPRNFKRNPRKVSAKQTRGEAQMLANLAKAELKDHGPTPQWFRCEVCQGRSPTPIHESHGVAA